MSRVPVVHILNPASPSVVNAAHLMKILLPKSKQRIMQDRKTSSTSPLLDHIDHQPSAFSNSNNVIQYKDVSHFIRQERGYLDLCKPIYHLLIKSECWYAKRECH